jgi:hypothetical protein
MNENDVLDMMEIGGMSLSSQIALMSERVNIQTSWSGRRRRWRPRPI